MPRIASRCAEHARPRRRGGRGRRARRRSSSARSRGSRRGPGCARRGGRPCRRRGRHCRSWLPTGWRGGQRLLTAVTDGAVSGTRARRRRPRPPGMCRSSSTRAACPQGCIGNPAGRARTSRRTRSDGHAAGLTTHTRLHSRRPIGRRLEVRRRGCSSGIVPADVGWAVSVSTPSPSSGRAGGMITVIDIVSWLASSIPTIVAGRQ